MESETLHSLQAKQIEKTTDEDLKIDKKEEIKSQRRYKESIYSLQSGCNNCIKRSPTQYVGDKER